MDRNVELNVAQGPNSIPILHFLSEENFFELFLSNYTLNNILIHDYLFLKKELAFSTSFSWSNNKVFNTVNFYLSKISFLASHFIAFCSCQTVRYVGR